MSEKLPSYRFIDTTGGSGPLVTFERAHAHASAVAPHGLVESVVFQKGLHGGTWFRVNLFPSFEGAVAMGPTQHALWEGETLGPDFSWKNDKELEPAIIAACGRLEASAKKFFAPFEKQRVKYDALFGNLLAHYADWLKTVGKNLPPDAFVDDESSGKLPAFEDFCGWLAKKKLTQGVKGDLQTSLWRFWHGARPMRESDYRHDDYYDCTKCKAFVRRKRGRLEKHKLAGFGDHFAFVCPKH